MKIRNKKVLISVLFIFSLLMGCGRNKANQLNEIKMSSTTKKPDILKQNSIKKCVEKWKLDSNGCLHIRDKEMAEVIYNSLNMGAISRQMVYLYFGKPNEEKKISEHEYTLTYYCGSLCHGDTLVKESETKSYATFYIHADTVSFMKFWFE